MSFQEQFDELSGKLVKKQSQLEQFKGQQVKLSGRGSSVAKNARLTIGTAITNTTKRINEIQNQLSDLLTANPEFKKDEPEPVLMMSPVSLPPPSPQPGLQPTNFETPKINLPKFNLTSAGFIIAGVVIIGLLLSGGKKKRG